MTKVKLPRHWKFGFNPSRLEWWGGGVPGFSSLVCLLLVARGWKQEQRHLVIPHPDAPAFRRNGDLLKASDGFSRKK